MRFFFDANFPLRMVNVLNGSQEENSGVEMVHLTALFEPNTPDVQWLSELHAHGDWIIVSGDTRITRSPAERYAWVESGFSAFFFGEPFCNDSYWKKLSAFAAWWPAIHLQAKRTPRGFGFRMPKKGSELQQIYPV